MNPLFLIKFYVQNPKRLRHRIIERWPWLVPDKFIVSRLYRNALGRKMDWKHPKSFNEKLQWLKIYDRKPIHTVMADKYAAKTWIEERIGPGYTVPNLGVWDSFDQIDFDALPDQFVLKTNHDSGGVVVVKDKSTMDKMAAKQKLENSLKRNYYSIFREWPYKNIPRKIIAEQYLEDESGELTDYKFFCFNGEPKAMFIATERMSTDETKFDFYDLEFNHLPFVNGHPNASLPLKKPAVWDEMIRISRILSKDEIHLRVDFYCCEGKLYVGELTFYHWSGLVPFQPEEWDYKLGEWLKLPIDS